MYPRILSRLIGSIRPVNDPHHSLLSNLDQSIATFAAIRTPDSVSTAAFDTLKQARAMIALAFAAERQSWHSQDAAECLSHQIR